MDSQRQSADEGRYAGRCAGRHRPGRRSEKGGTGRRGRTLRRWFIALAGASLLPGPAGAGGLAAQTVQVAPASQPAAVRAPDPAAARAGAIRGIVIDATTGAPLPTAMVRLLGRDRSTLSDEQGRFAFPDVAVGSHNLVVERLGYQAAAFADVIVHPTRTTQVVAELSLQPLALQGIEVGPGYFRRSEREPVSVTTLSAEEIRRAPGLGIDVSRTLGSLPSMAQLGEGRNDLLVRGGSSMENGFYIDNIPVPNINHFPSEGQTGGPIGMLNISFIQDVRASVGGFSALYGDRLSSVIDIQYREGNREHFAREGQLGLAGVGLSAEGPLAGGRGSWMMSGHRSYLDLLVDAIGSGVAPTYGDLQGKVVYDLDSRHALRFLGLTGSSGIEQGVDEIDDDSIQDNYGKYAARQSTAGVNWRALWNDRLHSNTSVSVSRVGSRETYLRTQDEGLAYRSDNRETSTSLRSLHSYGGTAGWRLDLGGEATLVRARYDYEMPGDLPGPDDRRPPPIRVDDRMDARRGALFASATLPLTPRLTATPGLRVETFSVNGGRVLAPRLSASYAVTPRLRINAASGTFTQALPLFVLSQDESYRSLPHARASHLVFGGEFLATPALQFTLEGYRKGYSDMPLDPLNPERFPVDDAAAGFGMQHGELVAGGRARSEGVEIMAQHKRVDRFHALVSATWFRSRYQGLDGIWRDRLYDNRVIFQATAGHQLGSWDVSGRWLYGGGAPYTPVDVDQSREHGRTVFDFTRTNAERLPAYHALNLRVDRRFHFSRSSLLSYLSLTNAYGRDNVRMYHWSPAADAVKPMLDLGFLPVLGFEYRF